MPRGRSTRETRPAHATRADVPIPDKLYFRIGEVSELTKTKPYVLRFWETEFPTLRPVKSKTGHRLYRRQDVEMVLEIKRLLYERGYTIEGARRELSNGSKPPIEQKHLFETSLSLAELKSIRRELESVLTLLSRKC